MININNSIFLRVIFLFTGALKKRNNFIFLTLIIIFTPFLLFAENTKSYNSLENINFLIESEIKDSFTYSGLASFYNNETAYIISNDKIERVNGSEPIKITSNQSIAIVGHYKILIINNINHLISFKKGKLLWPDREFDKNIIENNNLEVQLFLKSDLLYLSQPIKRLKYIHLWEPFSQLCIAIEKILLRLNSFHPLGWGVTIILLSLLFKIFVLPANIFLIRSQRKVSFIQVSLEQELHYIKKNYSGEEAHYKSIAAHKSKGVTPFYKLRPLFLSLIPIPFLISIFNVLGELDQISGHNFLWIKDLAYPDAILTFDNYIPLFGNSFNLLPILMTLLSIFGAIYYQNKIIGTKDLNKQRLNLYIMSLGFFLLFYSFPSVMVLYWTFANIWQIIQQKFFSI